MVWLRLLAALGVGSVLALLVGSIVTAGALAGNAAALAGLAVVALLVVALAVYGDRFDRGSVYW